MKKRLFHLILAFSLLTVFTNCINIDSSDQENNSIGTIVSQNPGYCTFKLALSKDSSARVVSPSSFTKESLYYKFSYLDSAANLTNFPSDGSGASYATIAAKTFSLLTGEYLFALDAYSDSACTQKVLECSKTVTLTAASSSIALELKSTNISDDANAKGSVSVTMNFPASTGVTKVEARLAKLTDAEGSVDAKELTIGGNTTTKTVTYANASVASGPYIIYFTLSGTGIIPTVIPELVIVATGSISSNSANPISVTENLVNTNIIYVSGTGSADGVGTKANPFDTLEKAITLINSKNKTDMDWAVSVSGTVKGCTEIASLNAKSLTIFGSNSATDILDGDGNTAKKILKINTATPITLLNVKLTNGKCGAISVMATNGVLKLGDGVLITKNEGSDAAIYNKGSLFMYGTAMVGEEASSAATTASFGNKGGVYGGGIYNFGGKLYLGYEDGTTVHKLTGGVCHNIANGGSTGGGGIYNNSSGKVFIDSGNISYNAAAMGGGINSEGTLTISGSKGVTIAGNKGSSKGGGVFNNGTCFIYGTTVIGDSSKTGPVTESSYSNRGWGGGLYNATSGSAYLGYSTTTAKTELNGGIYYNFSGDEGDGGAIYNAGTLKIDSGNILYNGHTGYGGGICISEDSTFELSGGTISHNKCLNTSASYGGAVRLEGNMTMTGGEISHNTAVNGAGISIPSTGSLTMTGGTISENDGNAVHTETSSIKLGNSASIPPSSDGKNDVYLKNGKTITVVSAFASTVSLPVAKITPATYTDGTPVLTGSVVGTIHKKFAVTQPKLSQVMIDSEGKLKTVGWYKEVTGLISPGTNIANSEVFILGRILTIPSLIVGTTELTQEEYEMYGKYGKTDANMPPNSNYDTGSASQIYPAYGISFYDMIIFCNLRSMAEGLTPVYAVGGVTDPKKWSGIVGNANTGYCGPGSINSTWDEVTFNTSANGWRLPTEAEWEYLARGANLTNLGYTYSGSNSASEVGWYSGDNNDQPTAVKQKAANGLGLYDMSGNVFELCWDWYGTITASTPITGVASGTERTVRGGGCTYGADPYAKVGNRSVKNTPIMRWANCGVRLVRNNN